MKKIILFMLIGIFITNSLSFVSSVDSASHCYGAITESDCTGLLDVGTCQSVSSCSWITSCSGSITNTSCNQLKNSVDCGYVSGCIWDETPPETGVSAAINGNPYIFNIWITRKDQNIQIEMNCSDNESGCLATHFCIDTDNTCIPTSSIETPNSFGWGLRTTNYLRYYSSDNASNIEEIKSQSILVDYTAPYIIIKSPQNISYFDNATVLVNISASDVNLQSVWYNWNNTNITYTTPVYVTFNEGSNTLYAYVNDSAGNVNSTNITFTIDTIPPAINLISPDDAYSTTLTSIIFSYNVTDADNISNCSLIINNAVDQTNITITANITSTFTKDFSVGTYTWKIECIDIANNQGNSSLRSLTIISSSPPSEGGSGGSSSGGGGGSVRGFINCTTNWTCTDWASCVDGKQIRVCSFPLTNCKPLLLKPAEIQTCSLANLSNSLDTTPVTENTDFNVPSSKGVTGFAVIDNIITGPVGIVIIVLIGVIIGVLIIVKIIKRKRRHKLFGY